MSPPRLSTWFTPATGHRTGGWGEFTRPHADPLIIYRIHRWCYASDRGLVKGNENIACPADWRPDDIDFLDCPATGEERGRQQFNMNGGRMVREPCPACQKPLWACVRVCYFCRAHLEWMMWRPSVTATTSVVSLEESEAIARDDAVAVLNLIDAQFQADLLLEAVKALPVALDNQCGVGVSGSAAGLSRGSGTGGSVTATPTGGPGEAGSSSAADEAMAPAVLTMEEFFHGYDDMPAPTMMAEHFVRAATKFNINRLYTPCPTVPRSELTYTEAESKNARKNCQKTVALLSEMVECE